MDLVALVNLILSAPLVEKFNVSAPDDHIPVLVSPTNPKEGTAADPSGIYTPELLI